MNYAHLGEGSVCTCVGCMSKEVGEDTCTQLTIYDPVLTFVCVGGGIVHCAVCSHARCVLVARPGKTRELWPGVCAYTYASV